MRAIISSNQLMGAEVRYLMAGGDPNALGYPHYHE